jgi:hypothetical protein
MPKECVKNKLHIASTHVYVQPSGDFFIAFLNVAEKSGINVAILKTNLTKK